MANPTHRSRRVRHTELLLAAAAATDLDGRWPLDDLDDPALVKTQSTPRAHGAARHTRHAVAATVAQALAVSAPARIDGRRIIVVDDVCATGAQIAAVAATLAANGATEMSGLVLAAAPPPLAWADQRLDALGAPCSGHQTGSSVAPGVRRRALTIRLTRQDPHSSVASTYAMECRHEPRAYSRLRSQELRAYS